LANPSPADSPTKTCWRSTERLDSAKQRKPLILRRQPDIDSNGNRY
jgi:hypothetical protein